MIAALSAILYAEWWIDYGAHEARCLSEGGESPLRGVALAALLGGLVTGGFLELVRICSTAGIKLLKVSGLIGAILLATGPFLYGVLLVLFGNDSTSPRINLALGAAVVFAIMLAIFAEQMLYRRIDSALGRIAATLLCVVYLGVGAMLILCIRLQYGIGWLVIFMAGVKGTDIGAYFTGTAVGRHKLIRWLSPGKSWEGLIGGLIFGAGGSMLAFGLLRTYVVSASEVSYWGVALFGVVVGAAGQFGDLCESLLKRSGNIKDSGAVVPEFGGILDIIDSPMMATPAALLLMGILI